MGKESKRKKAKECTMREKARECNEMRGRMRQCIAKEGESENRSKSDSKKEHVGGEWGRTR